MVPFLQPVPTPAFVGEGQLPSGRQQPVTGLPGFATLLGSAAPILPVGTPEALPDVQPVSPGLAAALLVAADGEATPMPNMATMAADAGTKAATPAVPPPTPVAPRVEAATPAITPDPAPTPTAPVQRDVAQRPVIETRPASADPAPADTPRIAVEPITDDTVETPEHPVATAPAPEHHAAVNATPRARDPLRPAAVPTAPAAATTPSAAPAPPVATPASDGPAQPDTLAGSRKVSRPDKPVDKGLDGPEQPCSVTPKTVPARTIAAQPMAPAPDIAPDAPAPSVAADAQSIDTIVPVAEPAVEPVAEGDARVTDAEVTLERAVPLAPAVPNATAAQSTQAAIVAVQPLPDDAVTENVAPEHPSATALGKDAPRLAQPAPQDIATVGDAPGEPEAPAIRTADAQPAQRTPNEARSPANNDSGEGARQAATAPAAPAPPPVAANAPAAFDQMVAAADAPVVAPSAEPRARAAAIGGDVAVAIVRHAEAGSNDTLVIRLDPGDLGGIEVRLKVEDGQRLSAELSADQPATLDLLRRDSDSLSRALNDAGFRTEGQTLRFDGRGTGQGGEPGFGQRERRTVHHVYLGEDEAASPSASAYSPQVRSAGRVDLFA